MSAPQNLGDAHADATNRIVEDLLSAGRTVTIINAAVEHIKKGDEGTYKAEHRNICGEIEKLTRESLAHLPKAERKAAIDKFTTDFISKRIGGS